MTRSVNHVSAAARARRLMNFAAQHGIACNREHILRRILAWDAQVAAMRRKYSATESADLKQRSLPFSADPSVQLRTHWPTK